MNGEQILRSTLDDCIAKELAQARQYIAYLEGFYVMSGDTPLTENGLFAQRSYLEQRDETERAFDALSEFRFDSIRERQVERGEDYNDDGHLG